MEAAGTPVEVSFEGQGVDDEDYKSSWPSTSAPARGPT